MAKQAIKKGAGIKTGGLNAFKERHGMIYKPGESKITAATTNADKPMDWIIMPKAFQDAVKLPGIPIGYSTCVMGHSNTGKSTLINHAIVSAQRQGIIPVIIDTENNFQFDYAVNMGMTATPIYDDVEIENVNDETGEITTHMENRIVNWEGEFLYFNSGGLIAQYGNFDYGTGKETTTYRTSALIEDVGACINDVLDAQASGEIDKPILFIWDSVGSVKSLKEYNAKGVGNNMWAAGAISATFEDIVGSKIPGSRKVSSKHTNTFLYVNKVWMDSMTNPVGPATMKPKGGDSLTYKTRLQIVMGGKLTAGIKKLTATAKGAKYSYAIESKIRVEKNHLSAPYNVTYEGPIIASDMGFIAMDELEDYKKEHISSILNRLNNEIKNSSNVITESDVLFEVGDEE